MRDRGIADRGSKDPDEGTRNCGHVTKGLWARNQKMSVPDSNEFALKRQKTFEYDVVT